MASALVKLCLEAGARSVRVMDFPFGGTAEEAYEISGIAEQVKAAGGEMVVMSQLKFMPTNLPQAQSLKRTDIYKDVLDADVLVVMATPDRLDPLEPIYAYCRDRGYTPDGEAVRVGEWPVQFIPVFSALTREAVNRAETADFEGVPFRVAGAVYPAVIALSVGRAKDFARVLALLE